MDIKVKKLCDVSEIVVPKEMTVWKVTDEQVQEKLRMLSMVTAQETNVETAETGDCVKCSCSSGTMVGRTVLLYPGQNLAGADEAEKTALGQTVGNEFTVNLYGEQHLKVEQVIRRIPMKIDELIKAQNIENISTIEEYSEWYKNTEGEVQRGQALQQIKSFYLDTMAAKSELEYDRDEMEAFIQQEIERYKAEAAMIGQEVEMPEEMFDGMKEQCAQGKLREAVERAICEEQGFVFTADMFKEELDQIAEQMPGMEDMLEEYKQMYVCTAYMEKAMELVDEQAKACLEV